MTKKENSGKLYAIADLHANRPQTWKVLQNMPSLNNDSIILAGDVCDGWSEDRFTDTLQLFKHRFSTVYWTPGNHELYTLNSAQQNDTKALRGVAKYERLLQLCANVNVVTPEDQFDKWKGQQTKHRTAEQLIDQSTDDEHHSALYICPIFTLYDYSFRPKTVSRADCLNWAQETKVMCTDEFTLHPDPYPTRDDWCRARVKTTQNKLDKLMEQLDEHGNAPHTVLASHFSLRYDMVYAPYCPRFSLWCGTTLTENWHQRYHADAVVYGHTHVRNSTVFEDCTFTECSLGYPNQYNTAHKITDYLTQILPGKVDMDGCTIC